MGDDRIVSRREPVKVEAGGFLFQLLPIPWRARNELGSLMVESYARALDQAVRVGKDVDGRDILTYQFAETLIDYPAIFAKAAPNASVEQFDALTFDEMLQVLEAALEVNGLERLKHMLDLGKDRPVNVLQNAGVTPYDDGPKTGSSPA